jgi:hypothetical protein
MDNQMDNRMDNHTVVFPPTKWITILEMQMEMQMEIKMYKKIYRGKLV